MNKRLLVINNIITSINLEQIEIFQDYVQSILRNCKEAIQQDINLINATCEKITLSTFHAIKEYDDNQDIGKINYIAENRTKNIIHFVDYDITSKLKKFVKIENVFKVALAIDINNWADFRKGNISYEEATQKIKKIFDNAEDLTINFIDIFNDSDFYKHYKRYYELLFKTNKKVDNYISQQELNKNLISAINNNDIETVKEALKSGADINAQDQEGWTSLHDAIWHCDLEIVKFLIESGADVNTKTEDGWTPLHRAVTRSDSVKNSSNSVEIIKLLIEKGADVNAKNKMRRTPLHFAVNRSVELVKLLIENGADVNAKTKERWTPLHRAVAESDSNVEIVKLLIENGADVSVKNKMRKTALDHAKEFEHEDIIEFLEQAQQMSNSRN